MREWWLNVKKRWNQLELPAKIAFVVLLPLVIPFVIVIWLFYGILAVIYVLFG